MINDVTPSLLEMLATELERRREISAQVINHIRENYEIDRDVIGAFLSNDLSKLEDYEIDLLLAPLFTPTLADQSVVAGMLGEKSIPKSDWPALVQKLVERPTLAQLVTPDGAVHAVSLRDVTIERYVNRLRLDGAISPELRGLIEQAPPTADRNLLGAVARRAIWESEPRRRILTTYLSAAADNNVPLQEDVVGLLKLAETYEPANLHELLAQIPHWLKVVQQEINDSAGHKPFFNERVEELHGGGRDQRRQDNSRVAAKTEELAFLQRLQKIFGSRS